MAGRYHQGRRIGRTRRAERPGIAGDARKNPAVRRSHGEGMNRAARYTFAHNHFKRGDVRRTDDEVSVRVRRRNAAIGQLLGGDESRSVRISGRLRHHWIGGRRQKCQRDHNDAAMQRLDVNATREL